MRKTKETCTVQTQLYTFVCHVYLYNIYIYIFTHTYIYICIIYPSTVALRMKGRYGKGPRCSHEGMKGAMMASIEIHNIK